MNYQFLKASTLSVTSQHLHMLISLSATLFSLFFASIIPSCFSCLTFNVTSSRKPFKVLHTGLGTRGAYRQRSVNSTFLPQQVWSYLRAKLRNQQMEMTSWENPTFICICKQVGLLRFQCWISHWPINHKDSWATVELPKGGSILWNL